MSSLQSSWADNPNLSTASSSVGGSRRRPGYVGSVDADGKPHGRGTQRYQDGSRFEGEFQHGVIHGQGVYRYVSGATYVGFFENGHRSKNGKYTFACGTCYDGEYSNDKRCGQGVMTFSDAAGRAVRAGRPALPPSSDPALSLIEDQTAVAKKFVGQFFNNTMHGTGTLEFTSGATYTGGLENNAESGKGMLVFNGGASRVEGEFVAGRLSGEATVMHVKSGERVRLVFKHGLIVQQLCVEGHGKPCDFKGGTCVKCRSVSRANLAEWLQRPEVIMAAPPAPTAVERPKPQRPGSAVGSRQAPGSNSTSHSTPPQAVVSSPAPPPKRTPPSDVEDAFFDDSDDGEDEPKPTAKPVEHPAKASHNPPTAATPTVAPMSDDSEEDDDDDSDVGFKPLHPTPPSAAVTPPKALASQPLSKAPNTGSPSSKEMEILMAAAMDIASQARAGLGMAIADCKPRSHQQQQQLRQSNDSSVVPVHHHHHPILNLDTTVDVRVIQIAPKSSASASGLARGDYILAVDGKPIRCTSDFTSLVFSPGQQIVLKYQRRHPLAQSNERNANSMSVAKKGEVATISIAVGCSITRTDLEKLQSMVEELASGLAGKRTVSHAAMEKWREELAAIVVAPHPQHWQLQQAPVEGTPSARRKMSI